MAPVTTIAQAAERSISTPRALSGPGPGDAKEQKLGAAVYTDAENDTEEAYAIQTLVGRGDETEERVELKSQTLSPQTAAEAALRLKNLRIFLRGNDLFEAAALGRQFHQLDALHKQAEQGVLSRFLLVDRKTLGKEFLTRDSLSEVVQCLAGSALHNVQMYQVYDLAEVAPVEKLSPLPVQVRLNLYYENTAAPDTHPEDVAANLRALRGRILKDSISEFGVATKGPLPSMTKGTRYLGVNTFSRVDKDIFFMYFPTLKALKQEVAWRITNQFSGLLAIYDLGYPLGGGRSIPWSLNVGLELGGVRCEREVHRARYKESILQYLKARKENSD